MILLLSEFIEAKATADAYKNAKLRYCLGGV